MRTGDITNFVIDANPSNGGSRGDALEKTVDYFTDASQTNPSVIVGFGQSRAGSGGLYLYTNNGSITGPWTRHTILASGSCYERTRSITFAGETFPNLVASCKDQIILFNNPGNTGGDPMTDTWIQTVLDRTAGAHQIRIADIDGDGKLDIVLSASKILGNAPNFILYQNTPTSWQKVDGPGDLQDDIDVISVGCARNALVGPAADNSGIYWFAYPGSRTGSWARHFLGAGNKGTAVAAGTKDGKDYVIVASNEDYPLPWTGGLAYYTQPAAPTEPWLGTTVDATYRAVHEISSGRLASTPYFIAAESEQACIPGGSDYHAHIPCRVTLFRFSGASLTAAQLFDKGTQNQSVLPYQGGLLVVGANHGVYGGFPALQGWIVPAPSPPPKSKR
jgi:hypothetical protein